MSYEQWSESPPRRRNPVFVVGAGIAALIIGAIIIVVIFPPVQVLQTGVPVSRKISTLNYPAAVSQTIGQPVGGKWLLPTAAAVIGDRIFVLDTSDNRILELDTAGHLVATLDGASVNGLELRQPMSIATDGTRLFVANSLAGQIVILQPSGNVEKTVMLETPLSGSTPRPIGIAVAGGGAIVVSDAANHRVLILNPDGSPRTAFGTGTRAGGSHGLNVPGGLTVDQDGYIYVVDVLNGRIVKLTPEGEFVRDFARLADTAGSLARPKGVAVDAGGNIFVSDGLQAAIEVFGPGGDYRGVIGRRDPGDPAAGSIFEAPSGLALAGNQMIVVDAVHGLIELQLPQTTEER
jgi:hypothetical protein